MHRNFEGIQDLGILPQNGHSADERSQNAEWSLLSSRKFVVAARLMFPKIRQVFRNQDVPAKNSSVKRARVQYLYDPSFLQHVVDPGGPTAHAAL